MPVNTKRIRLLREGRLIKGPVVYWMSRDQRVHDNWALLFAQEQAMQMKIPLMVVFCLMPGFLNATLRQYGFMLKGLEEAASTLAKKNISFYLLEGKPEQLIPAFLQTHKAGCLTTDFDPLRIKMQWKQSVEKKTTIPFYEVDAHNIVPCWQASQKQEYGAYTLRPKILRLLPDFLESFPTLRIHPYTSRIKTKPIDWQELAKRLPMDRSVAEVNGIIPGEKAARKAVRHFLRSGLGHYDQMRNDPSRNGQSGLSPYLHFGHISSERVALEIMRSGAPKQARDVFLEELIIRRELSENFCFFNPDYDSFKGFPAWAQMTLYEHRRDRRPYQYSLRQFEHAETHDSLWNAAQKEMVMTGKMHGFMRMYWAKKILEWTASPEEALETAILLNDKYELDGRDPNGYAGIAWSIGGVHDRAWGERPIFGKIRYMSYQGCRGKFRISAYITKYADGTRMQSVKGSVEK
jgi:deoxyribodipyrimidine photo-lyase